jgi:hypothetical protein
LSWAATPQAWPGVIVTDSGTPSVRVAATEPLPAVVTVMGFPANGAVKTAVPVAVKVKVCTVESELPKLSNTWQVKTRLAFTG